MERRLLLEHESYSKKTKILFYFKYIISINTDRLKFVINKQSDLFNTPTMQSCECRYAFGWAVIRGELRS